MLSLPPDGKKVLGRHGYDLPSFGSGYRLCCIPPATGGVSSPLTENKAQPSAKPRPAHSAFSASELPRKHTFFQAWTRRGPADRRVLIGPRSPEKQL